MNVYYSHDVMGKRKYMSVRKATKSATFEGHQVPNCIPYKKLADEINQIDIGTVTMLTNLLQQIPILKGHTENLQHLFNG